jgi:hypothetical protein
MKAYDKVEVWIQSFIKSALDGDKQTTSCLAIEDSRAGPFKLVHHSFRVHALCCYVQKTVLLNDILETAKPRVSPHRNRIVQSLFDSLPK